MKSYTDLEQSKKLAEVLPLESADMWYQHTGISIKDGAEKQIYFPMVIRDSESDEDIPCWSMGRLWEICQERGIELEFSTSEDSVANVISAMVMEIVDDVKEVLKPSIEFIKNNIK